MKSFLFFAAIICTPMLLHAQMDVPMDGGSIKASISEDVGITNISIQYWRPGVKGREGAIWGALVPYGFNSFSFITNSRTSPWRAGANDATVIRFEHDVKAEGHDLNAGAYALFMAVEQDSVTLIFSKQTEAWGSFFYKPEDDVLRVRVKPVALDKSVEWLKYEFIEHSEQSCVIALQWEKLSVPFRVDVDVENIVVARLRQQIIGAKGFLSGNLMHASDYCFSKNINLEEALTWAQRAVTGQPYAQTGFEAYDNLATGYEKLNRQAEADSAMQEALAIANIRQYVNYGRSLIAKNRNDKAIEVLSAARVKFGDVYAVNNALSYAYAAKGEYKKALEYANSALGQALSPQAKAAVTANIEKLKAGKDIN